MNVLFTRVSRLISIVVVWVNELVLILYPIPLQFGTLIKTKLLSLMYKLFKCKDIRIGCGCAYCLPIIGSRTMKYCSHFELLWWPTLKNHFPTRSNKHVVCRFARHFRLTDNHFLCFYSQIGICYLSTNTSDTDIPYHFYKYYICMK